MRLMQNLASQSFQPHNLLGVLMKFGKAVKNNVDFLWESSSMYWYDHWL